MNHKAGYVNLIGRPNAGKSTLMNQLVGERLSIITPKAQTTRHRILGIVNTEDTQVVFSDTPGMLDPGYALQTSMMKFVSEALKDADILILIIDVHDPHTEFFGFDRAVKSTEIPLIIALNKIDTSDQTTIEKRVASLHETFPQADIIPVSALQSFGIEQIQRRIRELLPESPPYFEKDALTDKPMRFFASEIIRERILENYQKEVPYSVEVEIEKYKEEPDIVRISALIYVARKSQKGIIIGHQGQKLKVVGTEARKKIEEFIQKKVFLEMHVKVAEDWRNKEKNLKAFGYKRS